MIRDNRLDFCKGVCIYLVVFGHLTHVHESYLSMFFEQAFYLFHIPVFFLISGWLSANLISAKGVSRITRGLLVPYFIFYGLYLIGLNIAHEYGIPTTNVKVNDVGAALSSIIMKPKGSFWFLHSLIFVMGTWLVVNMLGHFGFICKILLSVTLLSVLIVVFGFGVKWVAVIYFYLGILISRTSCQLSFMSPLKAILLFSILALNGDGSSITAMLSEPLLVFFVIGFFYWMYSCCSPGGDCRITSFFNRLGRCSMPILLFHAVFVVSIKYAAIQVFPSVSVPAFISFVISLVYALICCELCLRLSMLMTRFGLDGLLLGKSMMSVYHLK